MNATSERADASKAYHVEERRSYSSGTAAFTLIEMLTSVTILLLLVGLLVGTLTHTRERARRIGCMNNLRQLMHGALMYANDDAQGNLSSAVHDTNDVMTFLHPGYIASVKTYICPSTENYIRQDKLIPNPFTGKDELLDLTAYAGDITKAGTSYELFGFMNYTENTQNSTEIRLGASRYNVKGVRKNLSTIQSYTHMYNTFGLRGTLPGPSRIWLIVDGDERPGHQNYPDANNNHGDAGGNVSFCDGHVEWIRRSEYVFRYELSQDENRESP
jgi:prepilin-type processing-associated H-X9-DG protein